MKLKSNSKDAYAFRTMIEKKHNLSSYTAKKIMEACQYDSRLCLEIIYSGLHIEKRKVTGIELVGDHYLLILRTQVTIHPDYPKFGKEKAKDVAKLKKLRNKTTSLKGQISLLQTELSNTEKEIKKLHRKYDLNYEN